MAVSIFDPRVQAGVIEKLRPIHTLLLNRFFRNVRRFASREVDVETKTHQRRVAPWVRPSEKAKSMQSIGYQVMKITPAYMKPKKATNAENLLKKQFGAPLYGGVNPRQIAMDRMVADMQELWESILRRKELAAAELLRTGQLTISGDTINELLDFLMPSTHKITLSGTALWDNAASDPLAKIRELRKLIVQDNGTGNDIEAYGGSAVINALRAHADVRSQLDNTRFNGNELTHQPVSEGAVYEGRLEGINFYSYDGFYKDPDTGSETVLLPDDRLIMGSTSAENWRLYGIIEHPDAPIGAPFWTQNIMSEDPYLRELLMHTRSMPALTDPNAIVTAKVTA